MLSSWSHTGIQKHCRSRRNVIPQEKCRKVFRLRGRKVTFLHFKPFPFDLLFCYDVIFFSCYSVVLCFWKWNCQIKTFFPSHRAFYAKQSCLFCIKWSFLWVAKTGKCLQLFQVNMIILIKLFRFSQSQAFLCLPGQDCSKSLFNL